MSDSGFSDVAAMSLFIGTGITVARTFEEAKAKDVIDRRWTAQRRNEQFIKAVNEARTPRPVLGVDDFFAQRQTIRDLANAALSDLNPSVSLADETLKRSLVHSFNLEGTLSAMPGTIGMGPENMTDDMLRALLELSPAHMEHAERVYGSFGLLEGTPFGRGSGDQGRALLASLETIAGEFTDTPSIAGALAEGGTLSGIKTVDSLIDLKQVGSFDEVWSAVEGLEGTAVDEPERLRKILSGIYDKVGKTDGASLSLRYFKDADGEKLAGINIDFGNEKKPVHLGLMHKTGVVLGDTPLKAYSSLTVPHPEAERYAKTGQGRFAQNADIAMLDEFNAKFDDFASGAEEWSSRFNSLVGNMKTEESKLLMPVQENPMITERRRFSFAARNGNIGANLSDAAVEALRNRLVSDKYVLIQGRKAEGWVQDIWNINRNAVPGMSVFGQGPGADKEISQRETSRVLNNRQRKVNMKAASGRTTPTRLTGHAMQSEILEAFYRGMKMHSAGTHEDVAWLLDKDLTARYKQNIHVPLDSRASASLSAAQAEIENSGVARIRSNQVLGIGKDGTPIRLQGESDFLVKEMLADTEKGVLSLVGHREEKLGDLYKQFGSQKVVFQQGGSRELGWSAVALEGHLREMGDLTPESMEYVAQEFSAGGAKAIGLTQDEWMQRMKAASDVQFIGTQGVKKIAEKGLDVLAESLTEQIGEQLGGANLKTRSEFLSRLGEIGIDVEFVSGRRFLGQDTLWGRGPQVFPYEEKSSKYKFTTEKPGQFIAPPRVAPPRVASMTIQDTGDILAGKGNLVTRTRELMLMASDEGGLLKGRLSLSQALKDTAKDIADKALDNGSLSKIITDSADSDAMAMSRAFLFGEGFKEKFGDQSPETIKEMRRSFIQSSERQLRYGKHTYAVAPGGPADTMLGAGQRGSFAQSSLGHLRAQGGVMDDIAVDIAARTLDEQRGAAEGLQRRMASFFQGGAKNQIPIETIARTVGTKEGMLEGLFSINQGERNNVFEAIGKAHKMSPEDIAKMEHMNIGIGDGKSIYLERDASKLSGPFVTDSGIAIKTDMDKATQSLVRAVQDQSEGGIKAATEKYATALRGQVVGSESPVLREFAGKTYGSLRLNANPNNFEAGVLGDEYADQVGLRDKAYKKMLKDNMGLDADAVKARMAEFKVDGGYGLIGRDPSVDLHRVTGAKFFSMDTALRQEARIQAAELVGSDPRESLRQIGNWAAQEGVNLNTEKALARLDRNPLEETHAKLRKARVALWRAENDPISDEMLTANRTKEKLDILEAQRKEALDKVKAKQDSLRVRMKEANAAGDTKQAVKRRQGLNKRMDEYKAQRKGIEESYGKRMGGLQGRSVAELQTENANRIQGLRQEVSTLEAAYGTRESRAALQGASQAETLRKVVASTSGAVANRRIAKTPAEAVWLPKTLEQILGADYDADQLTAALIRGERTNQALKARVDARLGFSADYRQAGIGLKDYIGAQQGVLGGNAVGMAALEDFSYARMMDDLYGNVLKDAHKGAVLEAADVLEGTPEFGERVRGQQIAANLEKGKVGPMTNVANFIRDTLRVGDDRFKSTQGRIFGEALLGLMPEMVLKARQPGAKGLIEADMEGHMEQIRKIMSNDRSIASAWTREEKIAKFEESFKAVYKPTGSKAGTVAASYIDDMMSFVPNIVDAANSTNQSEAGAAALQKLLKDERTVRDPKAMQQVMSHMADLTNTSMQSESYRRQAAKLGITGESEFSRNIKNSKATFGDIIDLIGKHKKPALLGLGIGMGLSLLSSPGHISAEEADAAGARHSPSSPSQEGPDFGSSAPVSTGPGKSIRVRGTSRGDLDAGAASRIIEEKYPGADVSYKMEDYREQMNQEYLRKRLMR